MVICENTSQSLESLEFGSPLEVMFVLSTALQSAQGQIHDANLAKIAEYSSIMSSKIAPIPVVAYRRSVQADMSACTLRLYGMC